MAEVFAAVASGAGLVSLAIQLLESSQKLKGLYDASKDAPKTSTSLAFELETLSLQLRQLERHRQHDHLDTELLDRCIVTCEKRAKEVQAVVDEMARCIKRSTGFGRVYTAFREPEMRRLLQELEQAKSSLSLAYITYCQSWSIRDSISQSTVLRRQSELLAVQQMQLASIQDNILHGTTQVADQVTGLVNHSKVLEIPRNSHMHSNHDLGHPQRHYAARRQHRVLQVRLRLLAKWTWEFALRESQGYWTVGLHCFNHRPWDMHVFHYVRTGDIDTVDKLIMTRELSIWDTAEGLRGSFTLLEQAVMTRQLDMCNYLLTKYEPLRNESLMVPAIAKIVLMFGSTTYQAKIVEMFAGRFGLDVDVVGPDAWSLPFLKRAWFDTSEAIMRHQTTMLEDVPPSERFDLAMGLAGRAPGDFLRMAGLKVSHQLASCSDACGRTVLHWAAKKWSNNHREGNIYTKIDGLPEFIVELLGFPELVHSLDTNGMSPLTYMIDEETIEWDWITCYAPLEAPAAMVKAWGALLIEANISISDYVAQENDVLQPVTVEPDMLRRSRASYVLHKFCLLEERTLGLEVRRARQLEIWKFRPPPGLLTGLRQDTLSICWEPTAEDGEEVFWQLFSSKSLVSSSFVLTSDPDQQTGTHPELIPADVKFGRRMQNDDHSPLPMLFFHERRLRERGAPYRARRSASAPPLARLYNPRERSLCLDFGPISRFDDGQSFLVHQCLLDSRWKIVWSHTGFFELHDWRVCMSGCEETDDHAAALIALAFKREKLRQAEMVRESRRLRAVIGSL